jgi:hypothetical protein
LVKYEEVYLHAYDSVGVARASIGRYLDFYNRRPSLAECNAKPKLYKWNAEGAEILSKIKLASAAFDNARATGLGIRNQDAWVHTGVT